MMIGLLLHSMRPAAFSFAIFICLFLLSRHRRAGIFCFYLESGEVCCAKRWTVAFLSLPGGKLQQKEKVPRKILDTIWRRRRDSTGRCPVCSLRERSHCMSLFAAQKGGRQSSRLSRVGSCKQKEKTLRKKPQCLLAQKERLELSRRLPDLRPQQGRLVTNLSTSAYCVVTCAKPLSSFIIKEPCSLCDTEWRREWDSNPRCLATRRFSRPLRYDHFGTSPFVL